MIGRTNEISKLEKLYQNTDAQLAIIYGRRGVGKSFLINETFKGRITFKHVAPSPMYVAKRAPLTPLHVQLDYFYTSLAFYGMLPLKRPTSWKEAFSMLKNLLLEKLQRFPDEKQLIFFDECSWMDSPKSGFLDAFQNFWNTFGRSRNNLIFLLCTSSTFWITDRLQNHYRFLYDSFSLQIKLPPFSFHECCQYFLEEKISFSYQNSILAYMITGGIPSYLSYFSKKLSLVQNINSLFFYSDAKLRREFHYLFSCISYRPGLGMQIVELLASKNEGFTRKEMAAYLNCKSGGTFSRTLQELIDNGFLIKYVPCGFSKREEHYKLVDSFCMFFVRFVMHRKSLDDSWQIFALDYLIVFYSVPDKLHTIVFLDDFYPRK